MVYHCRCLLQIAFFGVLTQSNRIHSILFNTILMSTRLFVKNIPKHISEERLKDFFAQKGTVTDVKILSRK